MKANDRRVRRVMQFSLKTTEVTLDVMIADQKELWKIEPNKRPYIDADIKALQQAQELVKKQIADI